MIPVLKKALHFLLFALIGAFVFWLVLRNISVEDLKQELLTANYKYVLLSFVASFVTYLSRAIRWRLLIETLGCQVKVSNAFASLMTGYLANFVFPRIGEITRCGVLAKKEDISVDKLIGTVILERAIDLLVLVLLIILLFVAKYATFGVFIVEQAKRYLQSLNMPSAVFWILFIGLTTLIYLIYRKYKVRINALGFVQKFRRSLKGIGKGIRTILRLEKNWQFIFHTILIWVMYWLMIYLVFFALPATSVLSPVDAVFLMVMGGIGMSLPVQGGIGTFHAIVALSLTLYGIELKTGLNFALLVHESQLLFGILLGLISLIVLYISKQKNLKQSRNELSGNHSI